MHYLSALSSQLFDVDGDDRMRTLICSHTNPPEKRGEVYDLFIQLADPTCAIGFVTVAPLAHYVTG